MPSADQLITLKYTGIDAQKRRIDRVIERVQNPAMDPVVRNIAEVWKVNFDSEGGKVGGWRELAEMTQAVRAERGFDPRNPILVQTGGLRRVAIERLTNATGSTSGRTDGASMRLAIGRASALLSITGRKVSNQFKARQRSGFGAFSRPARRFWYVDDEVKAAAHRGLREGILSDIKAGR